jgi:hypothetical protein
LIQVVDSVVARRRRRFGDEEPSVKKGRHRRYEEARKFQRENAEASFTVEDFDFEEPDLFSKDKEDDPDDQYGDLAEKYDDYSELAAKYADFDESDEEKT